MPARIADHEGLVEVLLLLLKVRPRHEIRDMMTPRDGCRRTRPMRIVIAREREPAAVFMNVDLSERGEFAVRIRRGHNQRRRMLELLQKGGRIVVIVVEVKAEYVHIRIARIAVEIGLRR